LTTRNIEYLASEDSSIGLIALRRRELLSRPGTVVTEITLDHEFLMSSLHTASERALADVAVAMHGGENLRAIVGGLGLGYTAEAVLAAKQVADLEVVEFLEPVIDWMKNGLVPLSEKLGADARLRVSHGDVYARLWSEPTDPWDLVLIDVDHSPDEPLGPESDSFYSEEGLRRARAHLAPGGILGVWSYAESSPFADALARVFPEVKVEEVRFWNHICEEEETNWLFFARG
jgi:spermidine synthase